MQYGFPAITIVALREHVTTPPPVQIFPLNRGSMTRVYSEHHAEPADSEQPPFAPWLSREVFISAVSDPRRSAELEQVCRRLSIRFELLGQTPNRKRIANREI